MRRAVGVALRRLARFRLTVVSRSSTQPLAPSTMDVSGMYCIALNWLCSTRIHLDLPLSYRFQHSPRIEYSLIEGGIAVDGADAEEFDAWIVGCEEEGVRILYST